MAFVNCICMYLLLMMHSHTYKAETLGILTPKPEILAQLYHIQDETIRNMTAIQLFVCPTTPICSTNIDFLQLDKDRPTPQNCCSTCDCTPDCILTDTCCVDYYENFKDKHHEEIYKCYTPMYRQTETIESNSKRWLISKCPDVNTVDVQANSWLCESEFRSHWLRKDYRRGTPVTGKHHMRSYRNMYCALCYKLQEEDVIFWTPSVQGSKSHVELNTTLEMITNLVESHKSELNILFIPPAGVGAEAHTCVISQCKETGSWTTFYNFVEQACMFYSNNYRKNGKIYRNIFCAICNEINVSPYECVAELNEETNFDWSIPYISTYDVRVLDPPQGQPNKIVCPKGFIWDKVTIGCRKLSCPDYSQLVNNNCELVYSQVKGYRFFVMPMFFKRNKPFPFSVESIKHMYYNVTSEINKKVLNIFWNASMFPFDIAPSFYIFLLSEYKQIDNNSFECIKTDITGFHYHLYLTVSVKHENKLIDLKKFIETNVELLRDLETIGQYSLSNSLVFLNYFLSDIISLQLKFRSDLKNLEKMLYSENNDNAFNFDYTIFESSSSPKQPRTQQPLSQELPLTQPASSPQPPTTQPASSQQPPTTQPAASPQPPTTQPASFQQPPTTQPTSSPQPASSQQPLETQPPTTQPALSPQPPTTQPTETQTPTTQPVSSSQPTTQLPSPEQPTTQLPSTEQPTTELPSPEQPTTQLSSPEQQTTQLPSTVPTYHQIAGVIAYPPFNSSSPRDIIILMNIQLCTYVVFNKHEFQMTDTQFIILTVNLTLPHNQVYFCYSSYSYLDSLCICLEVYEKAVRKYLSATNNSSPIQNKAYPIFQKFPIETVICFTQILFYFI